jgi:hypothetical protein
MSRFCRSLDNPLAESIEVSDGRVGSDASAGKYRIAKCQADSVASNSLVAAALFGSNHSSYLHGKTHLELVDGIGFWKCLSHDACR